MLLLIAFEMTMLFLTQLKWAIWVYYIAFLSLPTYFNMWIYFSYKFKLNNDNIINVRRIIVYILLVIYIIVDCYHKFYSVLYYDTSPKLDFSSLFVYVGSVFFISLERVIKAIVDDYKKFKSAISNNVNI